MAKRIDDDLPLLIAQFRATGGKVSTNVVNGHNATTRYGAEDKFAGTREEGPSRNRFRQYLRNEIQSADQHDRRMAHAHRIAEALGVSQTSADLIIAAYLR